MFLEFFLLRKSQKKKLTDVSINSDNIAKLSELKLNLIKEGIPQ